MFLGYALYAGGIWKGDVLIADLEELEDDGRIGNQLEKTQCERGDISQRRRKIYFSNRRWTNQPPWSRSGTENAHLDMGTPNARRKAKGFSWRTRRFSSTTSRLISGCRWSDEWLLVHVRKLSYTAITLKPESNFTRREKNHSLFHWNTLKYPELQEQIWMLNNNAASTTVGTSMGQEICLILGQVSLCLFC